MQGNMPSFINGISFERLALGTVPFSILGVRHNPSLNSDHLGIGELPSRVDIVGGVPASICTWGLCHLRKRQHDVEELCLMVWGRVLQI